MSMNPRTLRPSSTFTPRSISGLALWLDASSSDLYTTDAGPVVAVASPLDIAGCALWLDGADSSAASMTLDGTAVGTWKDKSGNGRDFTATSTARPTLTASGLNGKSVVTFDGSNDQLTNPTNVVGFSSVTMFAVVYRQAGNYSGVITSSSADASPAMMFDNARIAVRGHGQISAATGGFTGPAVVCARVDAGATEIFTDGVVRDSDAVSGSLGSVTTTAIGTYRLAADLYLNGYIAEIIVYPTALTTAQRASVEAYLAARWGIAGVHAPATATSDPVGYWGDKSGNGRHAVQATAGSRPTVGSSSTAGKNAVRNNGTGSVALQVAAWPYTAGNTQFAVFNGSAINQAIYQRGSLNDEPRMAIQGATLPALNATRGGSSAAQTSSVVGYPLAQWAIGATLFNTSLGRAYRDGVYGADTTDSQTFSGDQELRLLSLPSNIYGINGGIAEFLYYDRQLTATEVSRVAAYLSRRWGITLAPQVSNADAQNWIDRVYANGGTVSSATAASVNTLCDSLDSASLRDRFYRLNLFCGTGLNAALVPLYRGPSLGGTQYGNATDTNVGPFVSGDFSDATGLAAGSGKYLRTGLTQTSVGLACHLAFYDCAKPTNAYANRIGSRGAGDANEHQITNVDVATTMHYGSGPVAGNGRAISTGYTQAGAFWLGINPSATSAILYKNGVSAATASPPARTAQSVEYWLFALNNNGSIDSPMTTGRGGGYSIGLSMDATQAAAYNTAMQAFQTSLTRNA